MTEPRTSIPVDESLLERIEASGYEVPPGRTPAELLPMLVNALRSPRSVPREASFAIFGVWILGGRYAEDELRALSETLLANLEVGIGEEGTDSVFGRSFSTLVLGKIVDRDTAESFLVQAEVHRILDAALRYLEAERDLRGFVPEYGWIHTAAHTGDLLRALAANPTLRAGDLERIAAGVAAKMKRVVDHVYVRFEDERLAAAVVRVMRRELVGEEFWAAWFDGLSHPDGHAGLWPELIEGSEAEVAAWHNTRAFLRSLSLQLRLAPDPPARTEALEAWIDGSLRSMDMGFYSS